MRMPNTLVPALAAALLAVPAVQAARATEVVRANRLPAVLAWPVYTLPGRWLGVVEAPVRRVPRLEVSRFTGQPLTVIYNDPASFPGAVDAYLERVPLPRLPRHATKAVYPRGY